MEILMNVSESLLHLYFINNSIPAKNKKKTKMQSVAFVVVLSLAFQLMTLMNLNINFVHPIITFIILFSYTTVRSKSSSLTRRIAISTTSIAMVHFSASIAFNLSFYLFNTVVIPDITGYSNILVLVATVIIARLSYFILAQFIIYLNSKIEQNIDIAKKYSNVLCLILSMFTVMFVFLMYRSNKHNMDQGLIMKMIMIGGISSMIAITFFYFILRNNQLTINLQQQKSIYDEKEFIGFTTEVMQMQKLNDKMVELITPVVETVNNFEHNEAKQFITDFFARRESIVDNKIELNNDIEAAINLKTHFCKNMGIPLKVLVKADKNIQSIFNINELRLIVTNIFDIAITEFNTDLENNCITFNYNTMETAIFIDIKYSFREIASNIISMNEMILDKILFDVGGYSVKRKDENMILRTIAIPYVGKSYHLKGSTK